MNPLLIGSFIITILVDVGFPLILILYMTRRLKTGWKIIGVGALIFIFVQILHIAFLFLINEPIKSLILGGDLPHNLQIAINAAILGILAGLFEETGRYLGFKHIMKEARTWNQGVAFGAGWGGVESIIIGFLVSLSLVNLILIPNIDINTLNKTSDLTPEQLGDVEKQLQLAEEQMSQLSWYDPLWGAVERIFAITLHIALTLIVLQCFIQNNRIFLGAAIVLHSAVDFIVVAMVGLGLPLYSIEAVLFLVALLSLWIIMRLSDKHKYQGGLIK